MSTEVLGAVVGVQVVVIGFLIRVVWRLNERMSRLEGWVNRERRRGD